VKAKPYLWGLIFCLVFITAQAQAIGPAPFRMHYEIMSQMQIGDGLSGEITLVLANTSEDVASDIVIRLPKGSPCLLGSRNMSQAGTLNPGKQTIVREEFFDPDGVSKSGSLEFLVEFTDAAGSRRTIKVVAAGIAEVDHEE
jgi:hypothetical protein